MQRDIVQRPGTTAAAGTRPVARTSLPGNLLAPAAARRFVTAALAEWTALGLPAAVGFSERLSDDAAVIVSELVTNAVVHAGTTVELHFRLEEATEDEASALILEVSDQHPARTVRGDHGHSAAEAAGAPADYGRGLEIVAALAERWGITYRAGAKTVWARLPVDDWNPFPAGRGEGGLDRGLRAELLAPTARRTARDDGDWAGRGALSFLAEASDLLAGQLDEDIVAALAGQLLVPRLADWCAIWLEPESGGPAAVPRLAKVWHVDEERIGPLRALLEGDPLRLPERVGTGAVTMPWPGSAEDGEPPDEWDGEPPGEEEAVAFAYRITSGGRTLGAVLLGRESTLRLPDELTALIEDFVRRVGLAVGAARAYTRQATISRILQRGLLPSKVAEIPGVASSLVYEPSDDGVVGGDFYDIFPCPGDRWCFVLGDVQGSGPEAAVVTGLARPWLRLLAREGFQAGEVLVRLNRLLLDDAMEAAEAAALMVAAAGGQHSEDNGGQSRFLSLLYGELVPLPGGGARCTLASAGHPLPLLLRPDGTVRPAAEPQLLLGLMDDAVYETQSFDLAPGDSLLCVTDGVTERRSGGLMFDDGDGLARALSGCAGLSAEGIAECIKRAVHDFAERPPDDDLALLVLQAE
ncbi:MULTISPECIES: SpoIIE family protein phosphatase [unclassified Streptomyces]|uniref:SpoIIE family protein phosphatase n=1 Tax=unclassified Streptomyces TaxID=2593676 RepID=UPI000DAEFF5E|nr:MULTISPECIES: SpoIIE family protein phosphatase [unclassified Streptomyces]PZT75015.1 protein phosphatase [Streptomyces sp. AC1-42T]PZT82001.1 protein phosphatase [Streptomyces sp. AC1-42W]